MPSKTDLSAYKVDIDNTLPRSSKGVVKQQPGKTGPKPKSIEEKQSMTISLTFTPSEYEVIKQKKGLAQTATYVKHVLITETNLLR